MYKYKYKSNLNFTCCKQFFGSNLCINTNCFSSLALGVVSEPKESYKLKFKTFIILYRELTESKFISVLVENLLIQKTYTLFVKVRFKGGAHVFYTCGSQLGI